MSETPSSGRAALLRRGVALESVTIAYNALEGLIAVAAGSVSR